MTSNEILKKRRTFIASVAIALVAVIMVGVYALSNLNLVTLKGASYGNINITKNSVDPKKFNNNTSYPWSKKTGRDWNQFVNYMESNLIYVAKSAYKNNVDPALIMGIIMNETGANPKYFQSSAGACGIMQVIPKYAPFSTTCAKLKQPETGIEAGTQVIKQKLKKFNETKALCGYLQGNNPSSNCDYARKVLEYKSIVNKLYTIKKGASTPNTQKTITTKTTKKTTVKTTKPALIAGKEVKLSGMKVYITATSKLGSKTTGNYYIYKNSSVKNGRIRVSRRKNGISAGWIEVNKITFVK